MEELLALCKLPYDPNYPVIGYGERPCFLIGKTVAPLTMQSGRVRKEHYAYGKPGSCALLAMIEPLTGERLAQVHPQRTKKEYTFFCQAVAAKYSNAIKIRMVQNWLNMIEIEFSALSRQCLNRRIPTIEKLEQKIKVTA